MRRVLLSLLLLAAGCSSSGGSKPMPMTIAVRDKMTRAPVASALVDARTVHFFAPVDVPLLGRDAVLDPSPQSVKGFTADDGTVRLDVPGNPVLLIVVAPGYDLQVVDLTDRPTGGGWLDADLDPELPGDPRRLEVRVGE